MPKIISALALASVAILLLAGCARTATRDPLAHAALSDMVYLQDDVHSARASSFDRTGANADHVGIPVGATLELANIPGAGCIRQLYFTLRGVPHLRDLVLRMHWDGEEAPSVEVPFADFFGQGHERTRFFRTPMIAVNRGTSAMGIGGFNSYFLMPFADGARLTLTNEGQTPVRMVWYHVNYETFPHLPENVGRFHAQWRRENPTTAVGEQINVPLHNGTNTDGNENYIILDAIGRGNLAGYFLNVDNVIGGWYGEGDDMIFIDGEGWPPSIHGTGSEEIFGGGACPNQEYVGPFAGYHLMASQNYDGKVSMYRFFVTDPIRFQKSMRVTIEHGHANNMANDYSSCAFWYQDEPHAPFPPLPTAEERRPRVLDNALDQAYAKNKELNQKQELAAWVSEQTGNSLPPQAKKAIADAAAVVPTGFEDRDYERVVRACTAALAELDAFLALPQNQEAMKRAREYQKQ